MLCSPIFFKRNLSTPIIIRLSINNNSNTFSSNDFFLLFPFALDGLLYVLCFQLLYLLEFQLTVRIQTLTLFKIGGVDIFFAYIIKNLMTNLCFLHCQISGIFQELWREAIMAPPP